MEVGMQVAQVDKRNGGTLLAQPTALSRGILDRDLRRILEHHLVLLSPNTGAADNAHRRPVVPLAGRRQTLLGTNQHLRHRLCLFCTGRNPVQLLAILSLHRN